MNYAKKERYEGLMGFSWSEIILSEWLCIHRFLGTECNPFSMLRVDSHSKTLENVV